MGLDHDVNQLLRDNALCFISTLMPDGSPQVTETWVDTDGDKVLINTVQGFQKLRNVERDPRVALAIASRDQPEYFMQLRGRVTRTTTEGGAEHIEAVAQRYTGKPYAWWGGRDQVRVIMEIEVSKVSRIR